MRLRGWGDHDYLVWREWRDIIDALPKNWRAKLKYTTL